LLSGGAWFGFRTLDVISKGNIEPTRGRIEGIASVEIVDREGETIIQDGMNLAKGTPIILEHPRGILTTIGEVVDVERTTHDGTPATLVKADLFLTLPLGKLIWEHAVGLQKAEASFQLGFSIEGKADDRDPTDRCIVRKSTVAALAVTMDPHCAPSRWEPKFAKGLIPIAGSHAEQFVSGVTEIAKSTIGMQQQGQPFTSAQGAELAPLVTQGSGVGGREQRLLNTIKHLGLQDEDLALAHLAKIDPTQTWAQVRALYRIHVNGGQ